MKKILCVLLMILSSTLYSNDQSDPKSWEFVYSIYFFPDISSGPEKAYKSFIRLEKKVIKEKEYLRFKRCSGSKKNCTFLGKKEGYISTSIVPTILPTEKEMKTSHELFMKTKDDIEYYESFDSWGTNGVVGVVSWVFAGMVKDFLSYKINISNPSFNPLMKWVKVLPVLGGGIIFSTGFLLHDAALEFFIWPKHNQAIQTMSGLTRVYYPETKELRLFDVSYDYFEMALLSLE